MRKRKILIVVAFLITEPLSLLALPMDPFKEGSVKSEPPSESRLSLKTLPLPEFRGVEEKSEGTTPSTGRRRALSLIETPRVEPILEDSEKDLSEIALQEKQQAALETEKKWKQKKEELEDVQEGYSWYELEDTASLRTQAEESARQWRELEAYFSRVALTSFQEETINKTAVACAQAAQSAEEVLSLLTDPFMSTCSEQIVALSDSSLSKQAMPLTPSRPWGSGGDLLQRAKEDEEKEERLKKRHQEIENIKQQITVFRNEVRVNFSKKNKKQSDLANLFSRAHEKFKKEQQEIALLLEQEKQGKFLSSEERNLLEQLIEAKEFFIEELQHIQSVVDKRKEREAAPWFSFEKNPAQKEYEEAKKWALLTHLEREEEIRKEFVLSKKIMDQVEHDIAALWEKSDNLWQQRNRAIEEESIADKNLLEATAPKESSAKIEWLQERVSWLSNNITKANDGFEAVTSNNVVQLITNRFLPGVDIGKLQKVISRDTKIASEASGVSSDIMETLSTWYDSLKIEVEKRNVEKAEKKSLALDKSFEIAGKEAWKQEAELGVKDCIKALKEAQKIKTILAPYTAVTLWRERIASLEEVLKGQEALWDQEQQSAHEEQERNTIARKDIEKFYQNALANLKHAEQEKEQANQQRDSLKRSFNKKETSQANENVAKKERLANAAKESLHVCEQQLKKAILNQDKASLSCQLSEEKLKRTIDRLRLLLQADQKALEEIWPEERERVVTREALQQAELVRQTSRTSKSSFLALTESFGNLIDVFETPSPEESNKEDNKTAPSSSHHSRRVSDDFKDSIKIVPWNEEEKYGNKRKWVEVDSSEETAWQARRKSLLQKKESPKEIGRVMHSLQQLIDDQVESIRKATKSKKSLFILTGLNADLTWLTAQQNSWKVREMRDHACATKDSSSIATWVEAVNCEEKAYQAWKQVASQKEQTLELLQQDRKIQDSNPFWEDGSVFLNLQCLWAKAEATHWKEKKERDEATFLTSYVYPVEETNLALFNQAWSEVEQASKKATKAWATFLNAYDLAAPSISAEKKENWEKTMKRDRAQYAWCYSKIASLSCKAEKATLIAEKKRRSYEKIAEDSQQVLEDATASFDEAAAQWQQVVACYSKPEAKAEIPISKKEVWEEELQRARYEIGYSQIMPFLLKVKQKHKLAKVIEEKVLGGIIPNTPLINVHEELLVAEREVELLQGALLEKYEEIQQALNIKENFRWKKHYEQEQMHHGEQVALISWLEAQQKDRKARYIEKEAKERKIAHTDFETKWNEAIKEAGEVPEFFRRSAEKYNLLLDRFNASKPLWEKRFKEATSYEKKDSLIPWWLDVQKWHAIVADAIAREEELPSEHQDYPKISDNLLENVNQLRGAYHSFITRYDDVIKELSIGEKERWEHNAEELHSQYAYYQMRPLWLKAEITDKQALSSVNEARAIKIKDPSFEKVLKKGTNKVRAALECWRNLLAKYDSKLEVIPLVRRNAWEADRGVIEQSIAHYQRIALLFEAEKQDKKALELEETARSPKSGSSVLIPTWQEIEESGRQALVAWREVLTAYRKYKVIIPEEQSLHDADIRRATCREIYYQIAPLRLAAEESEKKREYAKLKAIKISAEDEPSFEQGWGEVLEKAETTVKKWQEVIAYCRQEKENASSCDVQNKWEEHLQKALSKEAWCRIQALECHALKADALTEVASQKISLHFQDASVWASAGNSKTKSAEYWKNVYEECYHLEKEVVLSESEKNNWKQMADKAALKQHFSQEELLDQRSQRINESSPESDSWWWIHPFRRK